MESKKYVGTGSVIEDVMFLFINAIAQQYASAHNLDTVYLQEVKDLGTEDLVVKYSVPTKSLTLIVRLSQRTLVYELYDEYTGELDCPMFVMPLTYQLYPECAEPWRLNRIIFQELVEHVLDTGWPENPFNYLLETRNKYVALLNNETTIVITWQDTNKYRITIDGYDVDQSISENYKFEHGYWTLIKD